MTHGFDIQGVASRLRASAGARSDRFPLDVELAALHFPVSLIILDSLSPASIDAYLSRHLGWALTQDPDGRRIRGCLVAHRGHGLIFLEARETSSARRFTLAHELVHFIGHYLAHRELALARLGPSIVHVLDGDRPPTPAERLSGLLEQAPLGIFRDVLEREGGAPVTVEADRMEAEADAAAFTAVAPADEVLRRIGRRRPADRESVVATLVTAFGLARQDAIKHAPEVLQAARRSAPSFVESLLVAAESRSARERSRKG